jgi:hypothetical protein
MLCCNTCTYGIQARVDIDRSPVFADASRCQAALLRLGHCSNSSPGPDRFTGFGYLQIQQRRKRQEALPCRHMVCQKQDEGADQRVLWRASST